MSRKTQDEETRRDRIARAGLSPLFGRDHPPLIRGKDAFEAFYNSAISLAEQASALVRQTKPGSKERSEGVPGFAREAPGGRHVVPGLRGTGALLRIVEGAWVEWRTGVLVLCLTEGQRRTVEDAMNKVIAVARDLVDATVHARNTVTGPFGEHHVGLNTATGELQGVARHVPPNRAEVTPAIMSSLVFRLVEVNTPLSKLAHDDRLTYAISPDAVERYSKHSWDDEISQTRFRDPQWLDPCWIGSTPYANDRQRLLAVLYEFRVAYGLLENNRTARRLREAIFSILDSPCWSVESKPGPEGLRRIVEGHIPQPLMDKLKEACKQFDIASRPSDSLLFYNSIWPLPMQCHNLRVDFANYKQGDKDQFAKIKPRVDEAARTVHQALEYLPEVGAVIDRAVCGHTREWSFRAQKLLDKVSLAIGHLASLGELGPDLCQEHLEVLKKAEPALQELEEDVRAVFAISRPAARGEDAAQPHAEPKLLTWTSGYEVVTWKKREFPFGPQARKVMADLFARSRTREDGLSWQEAKKASGSSSERFRYEECFRIKSHKTHPAWNVLIEVTPDKRLRLLPEVVQQLRKESPSVHQ